MSRMNEKFKEILELMPKICLTLVLGLMVCLGVIEIIEALIEKASSYP